MKTQNIIPFEDGRISNPDLFNYNLSLLIDDFNQLMLSGTNLENDIYRNVAIYDRDLIEQSRFAVQDLRTKVDLLKMLLSKEYTTGERVISSKQSSLPELREDPLSAGTFLTNLCVDNNGVIELPQSASTPLSIKKISISPVAESIDGVHSLLAKSDSPNGYNIIVSIELSQVASFNNLRFTSLSDSSFDITQLNGVSITKLNTYGDVSFTFPTITDDSLDIHITLKDCRGTNNIGGKDLSNLFLNAIVNPLEIFKSYLYYFSIGDVALYNNTYTGDAIFVSESIESIEPSKILLGLDVLSENVDLEYYIYKKDYSKDGLIEDSECVIPILPEDTDNHDDLLVPASQEQVLTTTDIMPYDYKNQILFDTTTGEEVITGGLPYLRLTLSRSPKSGSSITIVRKLENGTSDTANAPLYIQSGAGQNVFVQGRFIFIPLTAGYPKLFGCSHEITYELAIAAITENVKYLKAQNNAIVINWEWFKNHYTDYTKTLINLVIIARATGSTPRSISLANVNLYINTFNDLI